MLNHTILICTETVFLELPHEEFYEICYWKMFKSSHLENIDNNFDRKGINFYFRTQKNDTQMRILYYIMKYMN